jgi:hypothetical protein
MLQDIADVKKSLAIINTKQDLLIQMMPVQQKKGR